MSPTQRTMKLIKNRGWRCQKVEQYIRYAPGDPRRRFSPGQRIDLLGIIDIIAFDIENRQTIGVQSCGVDFAAHIKKMTVEKKDNTAIWLKCRNDLYLIGWRKVKKKRGGKQEIWKPRVAKLSTVFGNIVFEELKNYDLDNFILGRNKIL